MLRASLLVLGILTSATILAAADAPPQPTFAQAPPQRRLSPFLERQMQAALDLDAVQGRIHLSLYLQPGEMTVGMPTEVIVMLENQSDQRILFPSYPHFLPDSIDRFRSPQRQSSLPYPALWLVFERGRPFANGGWFGADAHPRLPPVEAHSRALVRIAVPGSLPASGDNRLCAFLCYGDQILARSEVATVHCGPDDPPRRPATRPAAP